MAGFGAYGKIPALGDFFRIAPPAGFVEAWDPWLQARLLDLREAVGPDWRRAYLGAPIWRFSLAADLAGPAPAVGVLMPSVDRVGRDFPLTLVAAAPNAGGVFACHARLGESFAALEEAALAALGEDASLERLATALAAVPAPGAARAPAVLGRGPGHLALSAEGAAGPALLEAVAGGWMRPSVWSAALGAGTRVLVSEGLPGPERTRALFDLDAPLWTGAAVAAEARA